MLNRKKFIFGLIALCFVIIAVNPLWAQIYTPHISGVQVSYDTLYGNFGVGHFDFRRLTYAYSPPVVPWSEGASETHFVINIDGVYFTNHEYYYSECPSAVNLNPYITDHRIDYFIPEIVTTWDISVAGAPFTIRQILTPTWFDELGQVRIAYNITNSDAFSHSVGMKLFIDVKIVRRDDPPMQVGIAVIDTGSLWTYPYIPWYYQGYELSPTQPAENLSCRGYLRYGDCTTPDHFSIGQAYGLSTLCWDFDANFDFYGRMGSSYDDVGVLMRWDVTNLVAGASREYVTYYGLGGPVEIIPGLNLNATDELEYVPSACSVPTCLEVSGTAINNDIYLRDYTDVFVSIRLSDNVHYELRNDPPYSSDTLRLTSPAFLRPNEAGGFAWLICLTDTTYCTPRDPDTIFWESYVTVPAGVDTAYDTTLIYVECFDRTAPSAEIISPEGHVSCTVDEDSLVRVVLRDVDGVAHNFTRMRMWNADTSIIIDRFFSPRWLVVGDTLYKFKIPQIFLTGHCDTVHLSVIHAQDIYECTMEDPVEGFFVLDFQPPLVYFDDPECGESITDPLQPFRIQIIEEPCGIIDPNSFIVNINGVEHDIFDGIWDPDIFMFTIIPEDSLVSGDTNSVCITAASD
ncbi:hypothetical protein JW877_02065, partial [bacterium]|nr:hypothetical protein [bacterium]